MNQIVWFPAFAIMTGETEMTKEAWMTGEGQVR